MSKLVEKALDNSLLARTQSASQSISTGQPQQRNLRYGYVLEKNENVYSVQLVDDNDNPVKTLQACSARSSEQFNVGDRVRIQVDRYHPSVAVIANLSGANDGIINGLLQG